MFRRLPQANLSSMLVAVLAVVAVVLQPASLKSQPYNQIVVFGDSNVDGGMYRGFPDPGGNATYNSYWPAAVAAGAGAPVSRPGRMFSELLAEYFALTLVPANQGGTNFATSGAKNRQVNSNVNGGFRRAVPTVTQMADYLAARGNVANPQAIYLIHSGSNDVAFAGGESGNGPFPGDPVAYLNAEADALVAAIANLKARGAVRVVVASQNQSFPLNDANKRALRAAYNTRLFGQLTGQGVTVIRADFDATRLAIRNNPAAFGFTFVGNGAGQTACTVPAGITTAWALLCANNASSPSRFVDANADMVRLFADDSHFATHGHRIVANTFYPLIPSGTTSPLVSSILPSSRSVQVGSPATVFAAIVNTQTTAVSGCRIAPVTNVPGRFSYQATNPSTNQPTGTPNTPVSIPAGGFQTFILAFTPTAPMASTDVRFVYVCTSVNSARPLVSINTLRLTFSATPVPDVIAIGATPSNDGFARTAGPAGGGVFAASSLNIGTAATLTARTRKLTTSSAFTATICRTNPAAGGACIAPPAATVSYSAATNQAVTWGVFIQATGAIPADPAVHRLLLEFVDAGGVIRGSTSTAVTSVPAAPPTQ